MTFVVCHWPKQRDAAQAVSQCPRAKVSRDLPSCAVKAVGEARLPQGPCLPSQHTALRGPAQTTVPTLHHVAATINYQFQVAVFLPRLRKMVLVLKRKKRKNVKTINMTISEIRGSVFFSICSNPK